MTNKVTENWSQFSRNINNIFCVICLTLNMLSEINLNIKYGIEQWSRSFFQSFQILELVVDDLLTLTIISN